ncbi:UNVERIFIED_CONTAM: hypothetical protein Sradi_4340100 [Sesamum radiatum]|uniref:Uncharacterized protein n=1 Tax=Sesamum radiatum TaxID=300843 RepID=A0AAW2NNW0_SESRA
MCLIGTYCRDDETVMVLGEFALQLGSAVDGLLLMGRIGEEALVMVVWAISFKLMFVGGGPLWNIAAAVGGVNAEEAMLRV